MTIGWVNANGEDSERCPILAPNGKFDYRRYSAIYPGGFNCTMIGYYL